MGCCEREAAEEQIVNFLARIPNTGTGLRDVSRLKHALKTGFAMSPASETDGLITDVSSNSQIQYQNARPV